LAASGDSWGDIASFTAIPDFRSRYPPLMIFMESKLKKILEMPSM
jgi:hypothetical protein